MRCWWRFSLASRNPIRLQGVSQLDPEYRPRSAIVKPPVAAPPAGLATRHLRHRSALDTHILTIKSTARMGTDVIQGTLDLLILKTLSLDPMHGFGIARRVEQVSRGVFKVNPGSLLVALQRLERAGAIDGEWQQTPNARRARVYSLTRTGRRRLEQETEEWTRRAAAVARLLKAEA